MVLHEHRVGQAGPDLFVLAADLFEFFEHGEWAFRCWLSAVSRTSVSRRR
jgi:hypothetical protein